MRCTPALAAFLAASIFGAISSPVLGSCASSRYFGTFSPRFSYVYTPGVCDDRPCSGATSLTADLEGAFWALGHGNPAPGVGVDSGSWPALEGSYPSPTGWVPYYAPSYPSFVLGDWSADTRIDGCIDATSSCMAILLGDEIGGRGYFALLTAQEEEDQYLFARPGGAPIDLAPVPRATIVSSTMVSGGGIRLTFNSPPLTSAGFYLDPACPGSLVIGYKIYMKVLSNEQSPPADHATASWAVADGGALPEGAPHPLGSQSNVTISPPFCSGLHHYLATSLVFDSGFETPFLSQHILVAQPFFDVDDDCDGWPGFTKDPDFPVDCADEDPAVFPFAPQVCDGLNNDCNHPSWPSLEGTNETGPDTDGDGRLGLCDNCPETSNPGQQDGEADGQGDACDNCVFDPNPGQSDGDGDAEGDVCDLDDGTILVRFPAGDQLEWQQELGYELWNVYRGDLAELRSAGEYTQEPGSNPLADRQCELASTTLVDPELPPAGDTAFYLISGVAGGSEGSLGQDSSGVERTNAHPCP